MREMTLFEKLMFFATSENRDLFETYFIDKNNIDLVIENFTNILHEDAKKCGASDEVAQWLEEIPANISSRMFLYMNTIIESKKINKNVENEYFAMELGRDSFGNLVCVDFETGEAKYYEEEKKLVWLNSMSGKYILIDGEKIYEKGIKNLSNEIGILRDESGTVKFLELLHYFIDTKILVSDHAYYIADTTNDSEITKKLGVFLITSFAYRYKKEKQTVIKIPSDLKLFQLKKEQFIQDYSLYIFMGFSITSYVKSKEHIKKHMSLFKNTEDGITATITTVGKVNLNVFKFFKNILPNKEVYVFN